MLCWSHRIFYNFWIFGADLLISSLIRALLPICLNQRFCLSFFSLFYCFLPSLDKEMTLLYSVSKVWFFLIDSKTRMLLSFVPFFKRFDYGSSQFVWAKIVQNFLASWESDWQDEFTNYFCGLHILHLLIFIRQQDKFRYFNKKKFKYYNFVYRWLQLKYIVAEINLLRYLISILNVLIHWANQILNTFLWSCEMVFGVLPNRFMLNIEFLYGLVKRINRIIETHECLLTISST